jgi:hypothetical protein
MFGREFFVNSGNASCVNFHREVVKTPVISSSSWDPLIPKYELPNLTTAKSSCNEKEFVYYNDGLMMPEFTVAYPNYTKEEVSQKNVVVIE